MAGMSSHDKVICLLSGENLKIFPSQDAERVSDSFRSVATRFQFSSNDVSTLADLLEKLRDSADPVMAHLPSRYVR